MKLEPAATMASPVMLPVFTTSVPLRRSVSPVKLLLPLRVTVPAPASTSSRPGPSMLEPTVPAPTRRSTEPFAGSPMAEVSVRSRRTLPLKSSVATAQRAAIHRDGAPQVGVRAREVEQGGLHLAGEQQDAAVGPGPRVGIRAEKIEAECGAGVDADLAVGLERPHAARGAAVDDEGALLNEGAARVELGIGDGQLPGARLLHDADLRIAAAQVEIADHLAIGTRCRHGEAQGAAVLVVALDRGGRALDGARPDRGARGVEGGGLEEERLFPFLHQRTGLVHDAVALDAVHVIDLRPHQHVAVGLEDQRAVDGDRAQSLIDVDEPEREVVQHLIVGVEGEVHDHAG